MKIDFDKIVAFENEMFGQKPVDSGMSQVSALLQDLQEYGLVKYIRYLKRIVASGHNETPKFYDIHTSKIVFRKNNKSGKGCWSYHYYGQAWQFIISPDDIAFVLCDLGENYEVEMTRIKRASTKAKEQAYSNIDSIDFETDKKENRNYRDRQRYANNATSRAKTKARQARYRAKKKANKGGKK